MDTKPKTVRSAVSKHNGRMEPQDRESTWLDTAWLVGEINVNLKRYIITYYLSYVVATLTTWSVQNSRRGVERRTAARYYITNPCTSPNSIKHGRDSFINIQKLVDLRLEKVNKSGPSPTCLVVESLGTTQLTY